MKVNLYRLFAIQVFKGEKVAVYTKLKEYPDPEILTDAEEIAKGERRRFDVITAKPWLYETFGWSDNRKKLTSFTRIFERTERLISKYGDIDKAIFVKSPDIRTWRGKNKLYKNNTYDGIKTDNPEYSGCEEIGTIIL